MMDRIPIVGFTSRNEDDLLALVKSVQAKRTHHLSLAQQKRVTKSASKNSTKGKKSKTMAPEDALTKLLKSMTPAQLEQFKKKHGMT